jgi:hypothetical protein
MNSGIKFRFRMYRRGRTFCVEDNETGQQESLHTKDRTEATRLWNAKNETKFLAGSNLQVARAYMVASERHNRIVLASTSEADADISMVDLKRELFERLRKAASRELFPVIEEWERTFFWSSHVPCRRKRDYVRQVRMLARRIFKELSEDLRH